MIKSAVTIPVWLLGLLILVILILGLIVWSVKRRRRPNLEQTGDDHTLIPTMAGLLQGTFVGGNAIELLQNGEFFDRLFADLEAAQSTINFETFLCKEGELTHKLTEILLRKRSEGVEVRLLLDGSGGRRFGKRDAKRLEEAGCCMRKYHPIRISNLGRLNQRTHRKIAIIDGRTGYIGGHCFVDTWLGHAQDKQHFRDITARIQGPVVNQVQSAFTDNWIEETGEVIAGDHFFPDLEPCGPTQALAAFISPVGGPSTLKLLHYFAITSAKKSITIQNPYFLPDPDARKALLEAVKRGVEVRVMIPSTPATDAKLVSHASHHHYGTLLKGGVRVFDYEQTLLHQKVFTVDHEWASIGSTNFDDRSFEINDEISLVVFDKTIAGELEKTFEADVKNARERHLEEWKKRPVHHKLMDFSAFLMNEQL
jgi:cardiolipin synthase A/B